MPDHAPPPASSRFYAAIDAGRMECPRCGRILVWGVGNGHPDAQYWNPVRSTLECSKCSTTYQLGVLAWPSIFKVGGQPEDQQLSVRRSAETRQRAGGFWVKRRTPAQGSRVNRYVPEGCCCDPLPWKAECPVHGNVGRIE